LFKHRILFNSGFCNSVRFNRPENITRQKEAGHVEMSRVYAAQALRNLKIFCAVLLGILRTCHNCVIWLSSYAVLDSVLKLSSGWWLNVIECIQVTGYHARPNSVNPHVAAGESCAVGVVSFC